MNRNNTILFAMTVAAGILGAGCVTNGYDEAYCYPTGYTTTTQYVHYSPAYVQTTVLDPVVPPPPRPHAKHLRHAPRHAHHDKAKHQPKPPRKPEPKEAAKPVPKPVQTRKAVYVHHAPVKDKNKPPKEYKSPKKTPSPNATKPKASVTRVSGGGSKKKR